MKDMTEQERTSYALKGNVDAIAFCNMYFRVCQIWDDLIDKDKDLSDSQINNAFIEAMIEMPNNLFFQHYRVYLTPIMLNGILDWQASVSMERTEDEHQKMVAYTLRDSFNNIVLHCAYLIGGKGWVESINHDYRLAVFDEPLESYKEKL